MRKRTLIAATVLAIATPATSALAQATTTDPMATTAVPVEEDDNEFPWGLLGLIGLAGLLGRKRDNDHNRRTNP